MGGPDELTHKDIFVRLGEISAQIAALAAQVEIKRTDLESVKARLLEIEKRMAVGMFLVVTIGVGLPVVGTIASTFLKPGLTPQEVFELREELEALDALRDKTGRDQPFVTPDRSRSRP